MRLYFERKLLKDRAFGYAASAKIYRKDRFFNYHLTTHMLADLIRGPWKDRGCRNFLVSSVGDWG
jgi:hypothetical protein